MEKFSSDKTENLIPKESLRVVDAEVSSTGDTKIMEGVVSDDLETVREKMKKKEEERLKLEKESEEEKKRFEKDRKKTAHREWRKKLWQNIMIAIHPDTYASFIQNFEYLLFVLFVDTILITLLFSVLYGIYIIFIFEPDDWMLYTFKFVGAIVISILCIIIQSNVEQKPKSGA